jgi:5-methylthioadenosine/S-adenosylhomocysteine deaminase
MQSSIITLLGNAHVVCMDEKFSQYPLGAVAVSGDSIIDVGPDRLLFEKYPSAVYVDCEQKVLMPGLINAHTHVPMTLLRGLADDLRLDVWLMGYMMPVEREFVSSDFVHLGTLLGCAEMIRSGVTCFVDMYYFEEDVAKATAQAGMRAILGQTVLKFPSPDAESYEDSLALARDFIIRWKDHPLITPAVSPHAPYTCTEEILKACADLAIEFDVPLHTHISETALEVDNMRKSQGMPVVPYVKKHNLLDTKLIAAHCVHIDEGEMRSLLHANAGVAHNPSSNLKLASGIAPITKMVELGLKVGIGTDGPASNNDMDMFEEVRLAAFLAKGSSGDPTVIPAKTALLMATRMGAEAIHLGDQIGSISIGKKADLILVSLSPLHNAPKFSRDEENVYSQIVYAGKSSDVTDVMINGKWVMQTGKLLTVNEQTLISAAQEYASRIDTFLIQREESILSKLIAIGGATEEESYEIQVKVKVQSLEEILNNVNREEFVIVRKRHYMEYDTYFAFSDPSQGYIRFREDHFIGEDGQVTNMRNRLTHIGQTTEQHFQQKVILSRSRYLAPGTQSLRFYREYFKPVTEFEVEKDRVRFLITYKDTEFFINLDTVLKPEMGCFLEVKSRTWNRKDAEQKANLVLDITRLLGADPDKTITLDYLEMKNAV